VGLGLEDEPTVFFKNINQVIVEPDLAITRSALSATLTVADSAFFDPLPTIGEHPAETLGELFEGENSSVIEVPAQLQQNFPPARLLKGSEQPGGSLQNPVSQSAFMIAEFSHLTAATFRVR
jgi:hypothetical protein